MLRKYDINLVCNQIFEELEHRFAVVEIPKEEDDMYYVLIYMVGSKEVSAILRVSLSIVGNKKT